MKFATPDEAEQGFYTAMSSASIDAMKNVWLDSEEVACIHPMAQRILGYKQVINGWQGIFRGQGEMIAHIEKVKSTQGPVLAVHTGTEVLRQDASEFRVEVTNIYQISDGGWKMILHHASPVQSIKPPSRLDSKVH